MAPWAGEALILHDARARDGGRLGGAEEQAFREALGELSALVRVSFENATFSPDAPWFWQQFAQSITLDVGHLEAAGLDSLGFVRALPQGLLQRVEYVHLHRNASLRGGLTDHWPITASCRELQAVRALLEHKPQVALILEINETEELEANLRLLRDVLP
jgi:sugar phosphate isomerase/epimerase